MILVRPSGGSECEAVCLLQVKHKMSSWETTETTVMVMKMTVVVTDRQAVHDDRPH